MAILVVTLCAVTTCHKVKPVPAPKVELPQPHNVLSVNSHQIISNGLHDTFVIDTVKGKLWYNGTNLYFANSKPVHKAHHRHRHRRHHHRKVKPKPKPAIVWSQSLVWVRDTVTWHRIVSDTNTHRGLAHSQGNLYFADRNKNGIVIQTIPADTCSPCDVPKLKEKEDTIANLPHRLTLTRALIITDTVHTINLPSSTIKLQINDPQPVHRRLRP